MKSLETLTINDYVSIFRRRIWYVVITTVLITAGTLLYVMQLPPTYRSETTIAMSSRFLPEDYIRSIDRQTNVDRMEFVRQQVQSRTFLEGIVAEFHIAGPDGTERAAEVLGKKIEILPITSSTFRLGFSATDPAFAQAITKRLADKVIQLNDSFRKEKVQVADQYLEEQLRKAEEELSQAEIKLAQYRNRAFPGVTTEVVTPDSLRDLQMQLAKLDSQLESARDQRKGLEQRLQEHSRLQMAMRAPAPSPSTRTPTIPQTSATPPSPLEAQLALKKTALADALGRYTPLHPDVVNLARDVQLLEAQVKQAQSARAAAATPGTEARPDQKQNPLPALDASIDLFPAEIQQELNTVNRDITRTEQARNQVSGRIAGYQSKLNPSAPVAQDLGDLSRDVDAARTRYNLLSDKRLNSGLAAQVDSSENNEMFKIADPAFLPRQPIGPNRRMLASLGGLAGLLFGFGLAFLREFLDPSLHTEEEALAEFKLPILASIPSVAEEKTEKTDKPQGLAIVPNNPDDPHTFSLRHIDAKIRSVILNPLCAAGEHYRLLHTQLLAMRRARPIKSIVISSASPNEGKTFSACCVAGILAQEPGKKVLLIDGDLRRSNATSMMGLRHRQSPYNFNTVLRGQATLEESALRCDELNLYFLPAGPASANLADVLNSPQVERVLRECTETFDWVIIDSPPILAAADVNVMAPLCDTILLVVHSGKTPVKLIKESIKRVGQDRISGVLLNRVNMMQSSYYYGGGYYGQPEKEASKKFLRKRQDRG